MMVMMMEQSKIFARKELTALIKCEFVQATCISALITAISLASLASAFNSQTGVKLVYKNNQLQPQPQPQQIPIANSDFEAAFQGECGGNRSNPCEHICLDLHDGTYECACFDGFSLAVDGYSCATAAFTMPTSELETTPNSEPSPRYEVEVGDESRQGSRLAQAAPATTTTTVQARNVDSYSTNMQDKPHQVQTSSSDELDTIVGDSRIRNEAQAERLVADIVAGAKRASSTIDKNQGAAGKAESEDEKKEEADDEEEDEDENEGQDETDDENDEDAQEEDEDRYGDKGGGGEGGAERDASRTGLSSFLPRPASRTKQRTRESIAEHKSGASVAPEIVQELRKESGEDQGVDETQTKFQDRIQASSSSIEAATNTIPIENNYLPRYNLESDSDTLKSDFVNGQNGIERSEDDDDNYVDSASDTVSDQQSKTPLKERINQPLGTSTGVAIGRYSNISSDKDRHRPNKNKNMAMSNVNIKLGPYQSSENNFNGVDSDIRNLMLANDKLIKLMHQYTSRFNS